jgi:hypothetical protein
MLRPRTVALRDWSNTPNGFAPCCAMAGRVHAQMGRAIGDRSTEPSRSGILATNIDRRGRRSTHARRGCSPLRSPYLRFHGQFMPGETTPAAKNVPTGPNGVELHQFLQTQGNTSEPALLSLMPRPVVKPFSFHASLRIEPAGIGWPNNDGQHAFRQ